MAKFLDLEGLNYFWEKIKSWILERFAYKSDLNQKLNTLVSGQNIKTINNLNILGSGNVILSASDIGAVPTERTINGKALSSNITLNANDVNALPNSTTIPTKVSDLTNDSGFITTSDIPTNVSDFNNDIGFITGFTETDPTVPSWAKAETKPSYNYSEIGNTPDLSGFITKSVNDLTNYYLKSETYTKDEVAALIGAIQQFHYEIYATLPASGESNVLYLIGPTGTGSDKYEEYVYPDSTTGWTKIGDTSIDLSGYVTTSVLNTALNDYVLSSSITDVLRYSSQSLTEAQKLQARTNIGATAPEVFWATYGTTTAAEIDAALTTNKEVVCQYNNKLYTIRTFNPSDSYIQFGCVYSTATYFLYLKRSDSTWSYHSLTLENSSYKKTTLIGNESSDIYYPTIKAVADAVGKWGVISQTQTWSGTGSQPRTYVMSDLVYGTIPQANIDLFESAGATFNTTTGYFELNGLTDISYEEMSAIYAAPHYTLSPDLPNRFAGINIRTIIPVKQTSTASFGTYYSSSANIMCYLSKIERFVAVVSPNGITYAQRMNSAFYAFVNSHYVRSIKRIGFSITNFNNASNVFGGCYSLEEIELYGLAINISFSDSSLLNLDSVVYMVNNAVNTVAIAITLHADALARCTADTTEYEYNSNTYTGIVALANAKNITLAS